MDPRLQELSLENPVIYNFIMLWKRGDFTFDQALTECVLALAKINQEQFDMLVLQRKKSSIEILIPYNKKS